MRLLRRGWNHWGAAGRSGLGTALHGVRHRQVGRGRRAGLGAGAVDSEFEVVHFCSKRRDAAVEKIELVNLRFGL